MNLGSGVEMGKCEKIREKGERGYDECNRANSSSHEKRKREKGRKGKF